MDALTSLQQDVADKYFGLFCNATKTILQSKFGIGQTNYTMNDSLCDRYFHVALDSYMYTVSSFRQLEDIEVKENEKRFVGRIYSNITYYIQNEMKAFKQKVNTVSSDSETVAEYLQTFITESPETTALNKSALIQRINNFSCGDAIKKDVLLLVFDEENYKFLKTFKGKSFKKCHKDVNNFMKHVYEKFKKSDIPKWKDIQNYKNFKWRLYKILKAFFLFESQ